MEDITIFSLPTCPKCKVLKSKMTMSGIKFNECQEVERMQELGIRSAPALLIGPEDSGKLIKNFADINFYIDSLRRN